jgi:hypothetical protein
MLDLQAAGGARLTLLSMGSHDFTHTVFMLKRPVALRFALLGMFLVVHSHDVRAAAQPDTHVLATGLLSS